MPADVIVGLQQERLPVTNYVDAYYWRCNACGWLGTGHFSLAGAQKEAVEHFNHEHPLRECVLTRRDLRPPLKGLDPNAGGDEQHGD
jgi:hypothetical protein